MPAERRHPWPCTVVLLAGMAAGCAADNLRPAHDAAPPLETEVREFHPAGPTVVRTWRTDAGAPPYRIEIRRARSGRPLIGQARLLKEPGGHWFIVSAAGHKLLLPDDTPAPAVTFEESGQGWKVQVLQRDTPVTTPGIAVEGEASLDLRLERLP